MALNKQTYCCICSHSMEHLWTGNRRGFPDYYCRKCYELYILDPATGEPTPDSQLPPWIQRCMQVEKAARVRRNYWEKRGYTYDVTPLSVLKLTTIRPNPDLTDAEQLEKLGSMVGLARESP